jgi:Holliday junction resolvase RusA-like endonuclease
VIRLTILGEPASMKNSRQIVNIPRFSKRLNKHVSAAAVIKSEKARDYEREAQRQIPPAARAMLQGPVRVTMTIYYASERPDLDESVILDVMQAKFETVVDRYERIGEGKYAPIEVRKCTRKGVYVNDRQVREKHISHAIDKTNPRAEILVEELNHGLPLE